MENRQNAQDFSRERSLGVEHLVGMLFHMAAFGNEQGYEPTSQDYCESWNRWGEGKLLKPISRQSFSEARAKLKWEAIEQLLRLNEVKTLAPEFTYQGHVTRAVDGTRLNVPCSAGLLKSFSQFKVSSTAKSHYPQALLVSAINVFTGQPTAARVSDCEESERTSLKQIIEEEFSAGDLALLDRGLGGCQVFDLFIEKKQFFIARTQTSGFGVLRCVQVFIASEKTEQVVYQRGFENSSKKWVNKTLKLRLVRGPQDGNNNPIVFITNLFGRSYSRSSIVALYKERWSVETLYYRVKAMLKIENFHSRSVNGVMQEVFAHLNVISLAALIWSSCVEAKEMDLSQKAPNFKNVILIVRRNLDVLCNTELLLQQKLELALKLIEQASALTCRKQKGRSYPRISYKPISRWQMGREKRKKTHSLKVKAKKKAAS